MPEWRWPWPCNDKSSLREYQNSCPRKGRQVWTLLIPWIQWHFQTGSTCPLYKSRLRPTQFCFLLIKGENDLTPPQGLPSDRLNLLPWERSSSFFAGAFPPLMGLWITILEWPYAQWTISTYCSDSFSAWSVWINSLRTESEFSQV